MKITKQKIDQMIELHEKMSKSYFWNPPSLAYARRNYEEKYSMSAIFSHNEHEYNVELKTKCSCKHIYYSGSIYVDGKKKDIRALKKLADVIK